MPYLKPIACHAACSAHIQGYLERGGRAIARDFINLTSEDERRRWSHYMDAMRAAEGNDRPWRGRPAVTYQHFIISPDPRDEIELGTLRGLAMDWAHEFFGDELGPGKLGSYEVAVVYHDDNENKIPHAHVIVNNTDLDTGRRLQIGKAASNDLYDRVQALAKERGLYCFDGETAPERTLGRYYTKTERAMKREGRFVWKDDLANKVDIARRTTTNRAAFEEELGALRVGFEEKGGDYIFRHPSNPGRWKVTGRRLGKAYTKQAIERSLEYARLRHLPRSEKLRENVTRHVMRDFLESMELVAITSHASTVEDVARALKVVDDFDIRSVAGAQRKLGHLERAKDSRAGDVARAIKTMRDASFFEGVELPKAKSPLSAANAPATSDGGSGRGKARRGGEGLSRTRGRGGGASHAQQRNKPSGRPRSR